jgi:broad specificity phosphatase PhoE
MANKEGILQGQSDWQLSDLGVQQAEAVGNALKSGKFDAAVSSDLSRARDTADAICQHHIGLALQQDAVLRERALGWRENFPKHLSREEVLELRAAQMCCEANDLEAMHLPKEESSKELVARTRLMVERFLPALLATLTSHGSASGCPPHILLVSHGGFIKALLRETWGLELERDISNCSISQVTLDWVMTPATISGSQSKSRLCIRIPTLHDAIDQTGHLQAEGFFVKASCDDAGIF